MTDILLVADVSWVLNDVAAALSDGRHTVTTISDPGEVAERVATDSPDLLIIDLQIGSMGGMAVTRSVRDSAATSDRARPPILLLLDRDADAFLAGRSGADGWIRKPFGADDLREKVDELVTASSRTS